MDGDCLCEHVLPYATHLNAVRRKKATSVHEATTFKDHWVVAFIHDQHSNQTFITVDNEVTSELMHVFLFASELFFAKASEVTELGTDHDWDVPETDGDLFFRFIVNFPANCRIQGGLVGDTSYSAFVGVDE